MVPRGHASKWDGAGSSFARALATPLCTVRRRCQQLVRTIQSRVAPLVQQHAVCGGSLRDASPTLPSYPIVGVYGRPRGLGSSLARVEKCATLGGGTPAAHGVTPAPEDCRLTLWRRRIVHAPACSAAEGDPATRTLDRREASLFTVWYRTCSSMSTYSAVYLVWPRYPGPVLKVRALLSR